MDERSPGKPKTKIEISWDEATDLAGKISKIIGPVALQELKWEFASKIQKHYPDCQDYLLFHYLIGSSGSGEEMDKIDFPEPEYSVIKFLGNTFDKIKA